MLSWNSLTTLFSHNFIFASSVSQFSIRQCHTFTGIRHGDLRAEWNLFPLSLHFIQIKHKTYSRMTRRCEIISIVLWFTLKLQARWWGNISSFHTSFCAQQLLSEDHILLSRLAKSQNSFVSFAINSVKKQGTIHMAVTTFFTDCRHLYVTQRTVPHRLL
jgi:hypothetical protein